jgi:hypothetical protein
MKKMAWNGRTRFNLWNVEGRGEMFSVRYTFILFFLSFYDDSPVSLI